MTEIKNELTEEELNEIAGGLKIPGIETIIYKIMRVYPIVVDEIKRRVLEYDVTPKEALQTMIVEKILEKDPDLFQHVDAVINYVNIMLNKDEQ